MTQTITRRATAAGLMLIASAILITGLAGWAVSTTLFVLVHGFEYHWNIWQLLGLVFIRLVFTYIMTRYNVQTSAGLHITYDTLLILPTLI